MALSFRIPSSSASSLSLVKSLTQVGTTTQSASRITAAKGFNTSHQVFLSHFQKRGFSFTQKHYGTAASVAEAGMFCFQCEQTKDGTGCTTVGNCGKDDRVAALQDLLIHTLKGLSWYAKRAGDIGVVDKEVNQWVLGAIFSTLTNVNFDEERFGVFLKQATEYKKKIKDLYLKAVKEKGIRPEVLEPGKWDHSPNVTLDTWVEEGRKNAFFPDRKKFLGDDLASLQELVVYGIKGMAAYAHHALAFKEEAGEVYTFLHKALDMLTDPKPTAESLLSLALEVGAVNLKVMELLDRGNTTSYGHPEPTKVRIEPVKGKCILVSGHDLHDLEEILKQTEGKGINVYTHGELLPANAYPGLKKYKHLIGNYGGPWQLQKVEFSQFPGAIVVTTNCLIEPRKSYINRIFTRSTVGWSGVQHIDNNDYSKAIECALGQPGFKEDKPARFVTVGFGRNTVLSVADKVIDAVKSGAIKHFFLIGGCDGAEGERNYFREVAMGAPQDSVILTLACGKYRFNKEEFGDIGGIPRLLDVGQCNDAYSAIQIAAGLATALGTDVNSLPLSFVVSWFEQKAVAVLLTLLHLGIKNITLGPKLPAFCTPNMLKILVDNYGIRKIENPETDLKMFLGSKK